VTSVAGFLLDPDRSGVLLSHMGAVATCPTNATGDREIA
jgi:hypothetical protein